MKTIQEIFEGLRKKFPHSRDFRDIGARIEARHKQYLAQSLIKVVESIKKEPVELEIDNHCTKCRQTLCSCPERGKENWSKDRGEVWREIETQKSKIIKEIKDKNRQEGD